MLKSNKKLSDYNNNSRLVSNSTLKNNGAGIKKGKNVINRVSITEKKRQKKYLVIRKKHLKEFPKCQICGILDATEIHHPAGRIGDFLYGPLMSVDRNCHLYLHENLAESYEKGWLLKL